MAKGKLPPGVMKVEVVGSGITKNRKVILERSLAGIDYYAQQSKGKFWTTDFIGSLNLLEERLLAESKELPGGPSKSTLVWFELADREYQSKDWYVGSLLQRIDKIRAEIKKGDCMRIAGEAFKLGIQKREFDLKFKAEKALRDFEDFSRRHVAGTDRGNASKAEKANTWKTKARELATRHQFGNFSERARHILADWPSDIPKPGFRGLRAYLGQLGNT